MAFDFSTPKPTSSPLVRVLKGQQVGMTQSDLLMDGAGPFVPLTKKTVCYIVSAVIFKESKETHVKKVLLVQEAKKSCRGLWYLPAGRLEPGEDLADGAAREVLEEAGVHCQLQTLLSVDSNGPLWFRFNFLATHVSGDLKTLEQSDKESLQAGWFSVDELDKIDFRAKDAIHIIHQANAYTHAPSDQRHGAILPVVRANKLMIWKCVIFMRDTKGAYHAIRTEEKEKPNGFPAVVIQQKDRSAMSSLRRLLAEIVEEGEVKAAPNVVGVLNVEFHGKPKHEHDGFVGTLLVRLHSTTSERFEHPVALRRHLVWKALTDAEVTLLEKKTELARGCIVLNAHN